MKRSLVFSSLLCWALILFLFPASSPAGDSQAGSSDTLKAKTKEEMEAVKKDSRRIGEEALQSAKELPAQAGKEFKKTGSALKETGKELKESIKETAEDIKKMFKK
jgi:gas vesicle protein